MLLFHHIGFDNVQTSLVTLVFVVAPNRPEARTMFAAAQPREVKPKKMGVLGHRHNGPCFRACTVLDS